MYVSLLELLPISLNSKVLKVLDCYAIKPEDINALLYKKIMSYFIKCHDHT